MFMWVGRGNDRSCTELNLIGRSRKRKVSISFRSTGCPAERRSSVEPARRRPDFCFDIPLSCWWDTCRVKSRRRESRLAAILLAGTLSPGLWSQSLPIDAQRSIVTIRVFKSGLFSAFADNHEVQAPISEGSVDESKREVSLVIEAKQLKVLDPGLSPEKRAEVQSRMLGPEVLDSGKFAQIQFRSSSVEPVSGNSFRVHGDLSLHGQTAPISVEVTGRDGSYRGQCVLKHRAFGIQPISIAGGTVKVKDEVKIEFTIVTARAARQPTGP